MFDTISSFGDPNGRAFGVLGETISSDDGKIYVKSGSNTLNEGWIELGLAPTPTMTPTPSITPTPTPTPSITATPTQTPTPSPLPYGVFLTSYSSPQNSQIYIYTNSSSWTAWDTSSEWKLRFKDANIPWPGDPYGYEQLADSWNTNYAPIDMKTVGMHRGELYYAKYGLLPSDQRGIYESKFISPKTYVTMSILPATTFVAPVAPGSKTYLYRSSFPMDDPTYLYCGNGYFTSSIGGYFRLRCKLVGGDAYYITGHDGLAADPEGTHRANHWNNNYSAIFPLGPGTWSASLYAVRYNLAESIISQSIGTPDENILSFTVTTASTFVPQTPRAYDGGSTSNVYLSYETGSVVTWFKNGSPPPYIYTTDASVLAYTGYKLRAKWVGPGIVPSDKEHLVVSMQNQYGWLLPIDPGVYTVELYWIKYTSATDDSTGNIASDSSALARTITLIVI